MTRIYLAGPDVFHPNAKGLGDRKKSICARYGLEAVFPLDETAQQTGLSPRDQGLAIAAKDFRLLGRCSCAIVNLTPYLGPAMDTGSAVELGVLYGRGSPVWGYTNSADDFETRVAEIAPKGWMIERFGLTDNLMVEGAIAASSGRVFRPDRNLRFDDLSLFERCVAAIAAAHPIPG